MSVIKSILPILAMELETPASLVGLSFGMINLGFFIFSMPSSYLLMCISTKTAFLLNSLVVVSSCILLIEFNYWWVLLISNFMFGLAAIQFKNTRQFYMSEVFNKSDIKYINTNLGILKRVSLLVGAVVATYISYQVGMVAVYYLSISLALLIGVLVAFVHNHTHKLNKTVKTGKMSVDLREFDWRRDILAFTAVVLFLMTLSIVREAKLLLVPIYLNQLGYDLKQFSYIYFVTYSIEIFFANFTNWMYVNFGVKNSSITSIFINIFALSYLLLNDDIYNILFSLCLYSVGNALSSGIGLTLNSEFCNKFVKKDSLKLMGVIRMITGIGPFVSSTFISYIYFSLGRLYIISILSVLSIITVILYANYTEVKEEQRIEYIESNRKYGLEEYTMDQNTLNFYNENELNMECITEITEETEDDQEFIEYTNDSDNTKTNTNTNNHQLDGRNRNNYDKHKNGNYDFDFNYGNGNGNGRAENKNTNEVEIELINHYYKDSNNYKNVNNYENDKHDDA